MLFNVNESAAVENYDYVQESKYELGITGALMHVYENECNYNAILTSVGIAEAKYFQENAGADLFLNESGAMSNLIGKFKTFFKAAIEKIKAIFKKFFAVLNQFIMKDKEFIKKYRKDIQMGSPKGLTIKGYAFNTTALGEVASKFEATTNKYDVETSYTGAPKYADSDAIKDACESARAELIGESGKLDESELRELLKKKLYGDTDPTELEVGKDLQVIKLIDAVSDSAQNIKNAKEVETKAIRAVNIVIKKLEKLDNTITGAKLKDDDAHKEMQNNSKNLNDSMNILRSITNDITIICGAVVQAVKDENRQAKAICVKLIGRKAKNESAVAEGATDDIFGNVQLV